MPEATGGLGSDPIGKAFHARDPHLPTAQVLAGLEKPAVRRLSLLGFDFLYLCFSFFCLDFSMNLSWF
jgi:hypothetical protein